MSNKVQSFPQFRILSNGKAIYQISDDRNFIEIQMIGTRKKIFKIKATQYPEILKIQDMLTNNEQTYITISEKEWNEFYQL